MEADCIFCKIVAGEIPAQILEQDQHTLTFMDIAPATRGHALVIPKGDYVSLADFSASAPADLMAGYFRAVGKVAGELGIVEEGFRALFNAGANAGQEVPHLHIHLFGGKKLGPMLSR